MNRSNLTNYAQKQRSSYIDIIQSMLSQNYSIDYVAELMSDHGSQKHHGIAYWRGKILTMIENGEVVA